MLKSYDVVVNGMKTTLRLSDEDAAARGLTASTEPAKPASEPVKAKSRTPANKSRTPVNKGAAG
jgi:hypothetical protein